MKRIASRDNPFVRMLRGLTTDPSARSRNDDTRDLVAIEGVHLAEACLDAGCVPRHVVVGASAAKDARVGALVERAGGVDGVVLDDALLASVSGLATGAGLLFVIDRPRPPRPERIRATAVLLDRVQDPGNVGSILRSAAAAGVREAYLSPGCAGAWSPKVVRAAMGAHFALQIFDECALASLAIDAAVTRMATSPRARRTLWDVDLAGDVAWLFGHEGRGVDPALVTDGETVAIPQPGAVESLNVAASAAVCLFEQVRQRAARRR